MDQGKDYIKEHIHELSRIVGDLESKDGLDKQSLIDFLNVVTTVIVKINQDVKKLK